MKTERKYVKLKYAIIGLIFSGIIGLLSMLILGAEINEDFKKNNSKITTNGNCANR